MAIVIYIFYCLFCFGMMPYHAKVVSKSKILVWSQVVISLFWAYLVFYDYITDIPQDENGSVIVGMFMVYPFLCFISQVLLFVLHYVASKIVSKYKLAYNKPIKVDK
tara:strand:+ start:219 stop:539 length:321 start_codon:yes stop_codon:yes gene_type:complete